MKNIYLVMLLIVFLVVGISLISRAEEPTVKVAPQEEKAAKVDAPGEKVSLKIGAVSGNSVGIDLTNGVPVRGVQFTVEGVKATEVRTTSRTAGFIAKFNEKNGRVIMVSSSGGAITPGKGAIAEIICDNPKSARLSEIKIAGSKREPLSHDDQEEKK